MNSSNQKNYKFIDDTPGQVSDTDVIVQLYKKENWHLFLRALKDSYEFNDNELSDILNISVKTFRSYKKVDHHIDKNVKEAILLLISLGFHGRKLFGSSKNFTAWLREKNFYFDGKAPFYFLNTISGIRFVDDRLTAMEYGDNV